jgi:hypothetical protein
MRPEAMSPARAPITAEPRNVNQEDSCRECGRQVSLMDDVIQPVARHASDCAAEPDH